MSAPEVLRDRALANLRETERLLEELTVDPSYEGNDDAAAHVGYAIAHVGWAAEVLRDQATGRLRLVVDNTREGGIYA